MRVEWSVLLFGFFLSLAVAVSPAQTLAGPVLVNPGFETPPVSAGNYLNIAVGGEAAAGFTGWTVVSGDVDVTNLTAPFFGINWAVPAKEGDQVLDLNGFTIGSISQDFVTTAGQSYAYQFWYTNNPLGGTNETASVSLLDVATSTGLGLQTVSHTSATLTDADWKFFTGFFTAIGAATRITFASTSGLGDSSGGIIIDAVGVDIAAPRAAPEPSTFAMAGMGLFALFGARTIRRRQAARQG
jgi:hypothetical protein